MSLIRKLTAKPWEHAGEMEGIHGGNTVGRPAGRTGLYLFLAVITSMFLLFSISHHMRSAYPDWRPVAEPGILWFNTAVLAFASMAVQWAANAARRGAAPVLRKGLLMAAVFTIVFVGGQLVAWEQMLSAGYYASKNPANAFFYMFTAIHAVHLIGGMWFLLGALNRAFKMADDAALANRVSLCATYWHYLLLVWLLLFYLLLSS